LQRTRDILVDLTLSMEVNARAVLAAIFIVGALVVIVQFMAVNVV